MPPNERGVLNKAPTLKVGAGVAFLLAGLSVLSVLDATSKKVISFGMPILFIVWLRYFGHFVLVLGLALPSRGRSLFATHSLQRQVMRALVVSVSSVSFFSVLKVLPLAEATALNFLAPVLVLLASPWLLGEPLRKRHVFGVALGLSGLLIVIRPGGGLPLIGVLLGLGSAVVFALLQITTRRVAADDAVTTNVYTGLFWTVFLSCTLPWVGSLPQLEPLQWALAVSTGVSGALGHWLQIRAYRVAPASFLSPFVYLQICTATAMGWLCFGQHPDGVTAIGMAFVIGGGVLTGWLEYRARRAPADARGV